MERLPSCRIPHAISVTIGPFQDVHGFGQGQCNAVALKGLSFLHWPEEKYPALSQPKFCCILWNLLNSPNLQCAELEPSALKLFAGRSHLVDRHLHWAASREQQRRGEIGPQQDLVRLWYRDSARHPVLRPMLDRFKTAVLLQYLKIFWIAHVYACSYQIAVENEEE